MGIIQKRRVELDCVLEKLWILRYILSPNFEDNGDVIVIVSKEYDFEDVANTFNEANRKGVKIKGAILQKDDAVLVQNRLNF